MSFLEMNRKDREKTRRALLEYCKLDTYALIRLLEVLRNSAGQHESGKMAA
ncbi:MAG: hypothetical protein NVV82_20455 [Sporocytophaga sp.]|nr:hypothetical protein [Sporocytophaga sp.]